MFSQQARWDRKMPGEGGGPGWERAEVLARFSRTKILPMKFLIGTAMHRVSAVHYAWSERKGKATVYFFSVSDGTDTYRLSFDTETMSWLVSPLQ